MGKEKGAWLIVGGRRRLGRFLAEGLAGEGPLVLTSSGSWDGEDWVAELSKFTQVRTLEWDAKDPDVGSQMMADLSRLEAEGIRWGNAVVAAGTFPRQPLGDWTPEGLASTWRTNLSFPFLVAQSVGPRLEEGGSLQFLLDTAVHRPWLQRLPYSAAKAGLASLIPGLAQALAPRVRVVGHALGTLLPDEASDPAFLAGRSLLQRVGSPEDLLRAVRYVAASPFLTGEVLTLDGGRRWI